jgi:serine/threonine protein kinase
MPPFLFENVLEVFSSKFLTPHKSFGPDISPEAQDLILQLCTKDPSKRLCCVPGKGVDELRQHPFFKDFDWTMLFCRRMPSPFRGSVSDTLHYLKNTSGEDVAKKRNVFDSFVADTLTSEQQVMIFEIYEHVSFSHVPPRPYFGILTSHAMKFALL